MISFIKCLCISLILFASNSSASKIISLAPRIDDNIPPSDSFLDSNFYNIKKLDVLTFPTLFELTNFVMKKEMIEFKINNKKFIIFPMKEAYFIRNGKKTHLGKFHRISTDKSGVKIVFKNGDECIPGIRYKCIVNISAGVTNAWKQELTESSHQIQLNIKLKEALVPIQKDVISISSSRPTIGTKLIDLIKNDKKQNKCSNTLISTKRIAPKRTNFLIKNRILESAHTINAERLKKMALNYSKELSDENTNGGNKNISIDNTADSKSNQGSDERIYNTMISTKKKIVDENAGKNISDISKVFENIGYDQKPKKKKKKTEEEAQNTL